MLTPLQVRLADILTALPNADGFALAGAGGLLVHGLIDRTTRDLDYFAAPGEEAAVVAPAARRGAGNDASVVARREREAQHALVLGVDVMASGSRRRLVAAQRSIRKTL